MAKNTKLSQADQVRQNRYKKAAVKRDIEQNMPEINKYTSSLEKERDEYVDVLNSDDYTNAKLQKEKSEYLTALDELNRKSNEIKTTFGDPIINVGDVNAEREKLQQFENERKAAYGEALGQFQQEGFGRNLDLSNIDTSKYDIVQMDDGTVEVREKPQEYTSFEKFQSPGSRQPLQSVSKQTGTFSPYEATFKDNRLISEQSFGTQKAREQFVSGYGLFKWDTVAETGRLEYDEQGRPIKLVKRGSDVDYSRSGYGESNTQYMNFDQEVTMFSDFNPVEKLIYGTSPSEREGFGYVSNGVSKGTSSEKRQVYLQKREDYANLIGTEYSAPEGSYNFAMGKGRPKAATIKPTESLIISNQFTGTETILENGRVVSRTKGTPTDSYITQSKYENPEGNYYGKYGIRYTTLRQTPRGTFVPLNVDNKGRTIYSKNEQDRLFATDRAREVSKQNWLIANQNLEIQRQNNILQNDANTFANAYLTTTLGTINRGSSKLNNPVGDVLEYNKNIIMPVSAAVGQDVAEERRLSNIAKKKGTAVSFVNQGSFIAPFVEMGKETAASALYVGTKYFPPNYLLAKTGLSSKKTQEDVTTFIPSLIDDDFKSKTEKQRLMPTLVGGGLIGIQFIPGVNVAADTLFAGTGVLGVVRQGTPRSYGEGVMMATPLGIRGAGKVFEVFKESGGIEPFLRSKKAQVRNPNKRVFSKAYLRDRKQNPNVNINRIGNELVVFGKQSPMYNERARFNFVKQTVTGEIRNKPLNTKIELTKEFSSSPTKQTFAIVPIKDKLNFVVTRDMTKVNKNSLKIIEFENKPLVKQYPSGFGSQAVSRNTGGLSSLNELVNLAKTKYAALDFNIGAGVKRRRIINEGANRLNENPINQNNGVILETKKSMFSNTYSAVKPPRGFRSQKLFEGIMGRLRQQRETLYSQRAAAQQSRTFFDVTIRPKGELIPKSEYVFGGLKNKLLGKDERLFIDFQQNGQAKLIEGNKGIVKIESINARTPSDTTSKNNFILKTRGQNNNKIENKRLNNSFINSKTVSGKAINFNYNNKIKTNENIMSANDFKLKIDDMNDNIIGNKDVQEFGVDSAFRSNIDFSSDTDTRTDVSTKFDLAQRTDSSLSFDTVSVQKLNLREGTRLRRNKEDVFGFKPRPRPGEPGRPKPRNPKPPEPKPPEKIIGGSFGWGGKKKKPSLFEGFSVYVKRRGKFFKASDKLFTKEAGLGFGAKFVGGTAARSFKLVREFSGKEPEKEKSGLFDSNRFYRKQSGVFVEKSKYAIDTIGEKQEITFKGIFASKNKKVKFKWN